MIESFQRYTNDLENKKIIDDNAYLDNTYPNGDRYQHILQFVIPYHQNKVINTSVSYSKGTSYEIEKKELKFDSFDKNFGGLGSGLVRRTSLRSSQVFEGKIYVNSDNFNENWFRSLRENIPFYVLKYVTIKNGEKMYDEKGLEEVKKMFPELIYLNKTYSF